MKKFTKKLSLKKKTVANLSGVKGGSINKTDYTYCKECMITETCGCGTATCGTCNTDCGCPIPTNPCITIVCDRPTNPTGNPCQRDNC